VISQPESKLTEDFGFVVGVGIGEHSRDVRKLVRDGLDLSLGHARARFGPTHYECAGCFLGFGLGDPRGDRGRARPSVERGAVLG
jgi:hypothetical protein